MFKRVDVLFPIYIIIHTAMAMPVVVRRELVNVSTCRCFIQNQYTCIYTATATPVVVSATWRAVIVRSSREISQIVRIDCHSFLSCVCIAKQNLKKTTETDCSVDHHLNGDNCSQLVLDHQRHVQTVSENPGHNGDRLNQNGEKAGSKNDDNESLYLHGLTNVV